MMEEEEGKNEGERRSGRINPFKSSVGISLTIPKMLKIHNNYLYLPWWVFMH
jgi:hypothetical protein